MSRVRVVRRVCQVCYKDIAWGDLPDEAHVYDIQLHETVTVNEALCSGMSLGYFMAAVVMHRDVDDRVEHSIVAKS